MELGKVTDGVSGIVDIRADDSAIYLFGSELYCGWCLEAFTCPLRLKIHCHVEHLATCSCGKEFVDKQSLCKHVASAGCPLPPPFQWFHFLNLPNKSSEVNAAEEREDGKQNRVVDGNKTADDKMSNKSGKGLNESTPKTTTASSRKTLPTNHQQKGGKESSLQASKQRKFCCGLCSFQCTSSSSCTRHIWRNHGTPSKDSATEDGATENAVAAKSGCENLNTSESCCRKHSSDDMQFIMGCFSSPVDGKQMCCDLCSGTFSEWEKAAIHIYDSHFSALHQWRDNHPDLTNTQPLSESSSDKASSDNATDGQSVKLCISAEHVPKSDDDMCGGEKKERNVFDRFLVNLESNCVDTLADQSKIRPLENETKPKFTTDECKKLMSSICRLLKCSNHDPEMGMTECKTEDSTEVKVAATVSPPTKNASAEIAAAKQLISRKCRFCHRVCSTRFNCQRHEAVCDRMLPSSKKSGGQAKHSLQCNADFSHVVRFIHESKIFYCTRCGFSDSDQHAIHRHLMSPHVYINNRLCMKAEPGYDYVSSMRIALGGRKFRCSICGALKHKRVHLLKHLRTHSLPASPLGSAAALPTSMHSTNLESMSGKTEESVEVQSSEFASASRARSCPKCSRSFSNIANYLRHRAVCRAVQHRKAIPPGTTSSQSHYLFNFCEQTANGHWKCKLCKLCSTVHRYDVFKHIRAKHEDVQKLEKKACIEFSEQRADGHWHCRLCSRHCERRNGLFRHIRVTHAASFGTSLKKPSLSEIVKFCVATDDGNYQCTLCRCVRRHRSKVYAHIRDKHDSMFLAKTTASNAISSSAAVTVSSSVVETCTTNSTLSILQKSGEKHVKRCPGCSRVFVSSGGYQTHKNWCVKLGPDRPAKAVPSTAPNVLRKFPAKLVEKRRCPGCRVIFSSQGYQTHIKFCKTLGICRFAKVIPSAVPNVPQEPQAKPGVKRCPSCSRVFFVQGYTSHRKWCNKLLNRFVEVMSSGRAKCLVCSVTYRSRSHCICHIRRKHNSSGELANTIPDHEEVKVKTEEPVPSDESVPTCDLNKYSSRDATIDEIICKLEKE